MAVSQPGPLRRLSSFPGAPGTAFGSLIGFVAENILKAPQQPSDGVGQQEREMPAYRTSTREHEHLRREREPSTAQMHLSTDCQACGERVAIAVPSWMTAAMEGNRNLGPAIGVGEAEVNDHRARRRSIGQSPFRASVVDGAVRAAKLIRDSPLPAFLYQVFCTFFAFAIYMNNRFHLHQKLIAILATILEGLIEIEKEVGIYRNAGEALSVFWEAFVKSTIAMARSSSATPAPARTPSPAPMYVPATHHSRQQYGASSLPSSPPMHPSSSGSSFLSANYAPFAGVPEYELEQLTPLNGPGGSPAPNAAYTSGVQVHYQQQGPPSVRPPKTLRRTSYSSPSLPLLLSASSSSHLLPENTSSTSTQIPILTRNHSRTSSGNPPDYASATHTRGSMIRQRSRSEERCKGDDFEEAAQGRGWAGRVVGAVGRIARGD